MKFLTCLICFCLIYHVQSINLSGRNLTTKFKNQITDSSNNKEKISNKNSTDEIVCYPPLGCFNRTYYSEKNLPAGYFLPSNPEQLEISILHFRNLSTKGEKLRFNSTKVNQYLKNKRSYFIIHGWRSEFTYENWLDDLKDTILKANNGSTNVFIVDWSKFAASIIYPLSAENTKLVGRAIGYFIVNTLKKNYKTSCNNIEVIGHSLGGQVAGFIGKFCNSQNCKLKRIIALDAAGPFFRSDDCSQRVCKDDAKYVEALHTNAASFVLGGLGTVLKSGQVDFWPNGGSTQAGCDLRDQISNIIKDGLIETLESPVCSHLRAPEIYATNYDQVTGCQLVGYQCKDYESYKKGKCGDCGKDNSKCRLIGLSKYYDPTNIPLPKTDENYFVTTTDKSPYCLYVYQVIVKTSKNTSSSATGNFYINIIGMKRDILDLKIESPITGLEARKAYTVLVEKELPLEKLQKVEIYYSEGVVGSVMNLANTVVVGIDEIQINYMSHINSTIRYKYSGKFIPKNRKEKLSKTATNRTIFIRSNI